MVKITSDESVKDLSNFLGKATIMRFVINDKYEIEMQLPFNWEIEDLPEVIAAALTAIGELPETIHTISIEENKTILN